MVTDSETSVSNMKGECALRALVSLAGALAFARASEVDGDTNPRSVCDSTLSNHTIFDFSIPNVYGNETIHLNQFRGKVTLIVNVATYWGYVVQYYGLNALQSQHGAEGFQILGVPCNQFYLVSHLLDLVRLWINSALHSSSLRTDVEMGILTPILINVRSQRYKW